MICLIVIATKLQIFMTDVYGRICANKYERPTQLWTKDLEININVTGLVLRVPRTIHHAAGCFVD